MSTFVIWKYTLALGQTSFLIPVESQFLSLHVQNDQICLWFCCDPKAEKETRRFVAYPTGVTVPALDDELYLGTALLSGGAFVFHVFEFSAPETMPG